MMKVSELIEELKKYDPDAEVVYPYDEYGREALHGSIWEELMLVDQYNNPLKFENELIFCLPEDVEDLVPEVQDLLVIPGNKWIPAIKLHPY